MSITNRRNRYSLPESNISTLKLCVSCLLLLHCLWGCSGGQQTISREAGTALEIVKKTDSKTESPQNSSRLLLAGRNLETGYLNESEKLLNGLWDNIESKYLHARLAETSGNYVEAIKLYQDIKEPPGFLKTDIHKRLIRVLAKAKQFSAAADQAQTLWESDKNNPMLQLKIETTSWLTKANRTNDAIELLEKIKSKSNGSVHEKIELQLAALYEKNDRVDEAVKLITPLIYSAATPENMHMALKLLTSAEGEPHWTARQRLDRAKRLIELKAWNDATSMIDPLLNSTNGNLLNEARWLNARLLFKRRRHYKEAVTALDQIIKSKSPKTLAASFLRAKALSRLDRDEEAIIAYRAYAKKAKQRQKANNARFLAGRLEFFLGRHKAARISMEALVGNGKQTKKATLTLGRVRDAHFIAGLSAILEGVPAKGEAHLKAASEGSKNNEVIARNKYWYAVARLKSKKKNAQALLQNICETDITSWYAIWSAKRLKAAKLTLGACLVKSEVSVDTAENKEESILNKTKTPLKDLSLAAAFYKSIGLYKSAAKFLKEAEKVHQHDASTRDWIIHYVSLNAPQYSIRKASAGLKWPPSTKNMWQFKSAYPTPYTKLIKQEGSRQNLPNFLLYSIARKESLFAPDAISHVGAMGMMQMMPQTYEVNRKRAGLAPLKSGQLPSPEDSIKAAGFELRHLLDKFGNSIPLAIMAYNGGSKAVSRWLNRSGEFKMDVFVEKIGFVQTRNYIKRVYQNLVRYSLLANEKPPALPDNARPS